MLLGHDSILALRCSLTLHRELYTNPLSYETWLIMNLWELAVFTGLVLAVLLVMQLVRPLEGTGWRRFSLEATVLLVSVMALDVSGLTRAEVGRLWMPLMPLILIAVLERGLIFDPGAKQAWLRQPLMIGALLLANSLVIGLSWTLAH